MRALGPRRWSLFRLPVRAVVLVVLVHVVAAVAFGFSLRAGAASPGQWAFLLVAVAAYVLGYVIECREGTVAHKSGSYTGQQDAWILATAIVCPPWMVMLLPLVAESFGVLLHLSGVRTSRQGGLILHRLAFNVSTWALAGAAASVAWVLLDGPSAGPWGVALAATAAAVLTLLGTVLPVGLVIAAAQRRPVLAVLRLQLSDLRSDGPSIALGGLAAMAWFVSPPTVLFTFPLFAALQRSLLHRDLLEQSRLDVKTGLASAGFWEQSAGAHLARCAAGGAPVSLVVVDLDHFKQVNDVHGHLVGDEVLQEVARRLRAAVRPGDLVGRFGGEEFTVLLPGSSPAEAAQVAERVRLSVESLPVSVSPPGPASGLSVTCSVGVATAFTGEAAGFDDVLHAADSAMYEAKAAGRNRVRSAPVPSRMIPVTPPVPVG